MYTETFEAENCVCRIFRSNARYTAIVYYENEIIFEVDEWYNDIESLENHLRGMLKSQDIKEQKSLVDERLRKAQELRIESSSIQTPDAASIPKAAVIKEYGFYGNNKDYLSTDNFIDDEPFTDLPDEELSNHMFGNPINDISIDVVPPWIKEVPHSAESSQSSSKNQHESIDQIFSSIQKSIEEGNQLIFLSGAAGTGKTTIVRSLAMDIEKSVVVAPTGISALTAGGMTIHSFFQINPFGVNPELKEIKGAINRESVEKIECLIIDEISMVRADLFDAIDMTLRRSKNDNRPFGGISVIIVGDPYQLDPVLKKDEEPPFYHGKEYKGPYFFQSKAFNEFIKENKFTAYRLTKNFRADEDPYYASLLEKIRVGEDLRNSVKVLNSNCRRDVSESEDFGLFLTSINKDADRINKQKLSILPSEEQLFEGVLEGKYYNENTDSFPAPKLLELKVGAKVIFISNDEERRWVNGSQGLIKLIPDDKTFIQIEIDGETHDVYRHKWEKLKYIYDEELDEFYMESVGSFSQFPIKLGWALTIHRSQSLTLDNCIVDFGSGAFTHGQAYVALSRVRSIDDIVLMSDLQVSDIKIDNHVNEFYKSIYFQNDHNKKSNENRSVREEISFLKNRIIELEKKISD